MRIFQAILAGAALAVVCDNVHADSDFYRPRTHLGSANAEGKIHTWIEAGSILLPNGDKFPFRLQFSAQPPSGTPVFGKFWWCPLFESTLIPVSERCYSLSQLGGEQIYLVKRKDGSLSSGDGKWSGKIGVEGQVDLVSPQGWSYIYREGRLAEAKHHGVTYRWIYQRGQLRSIVSSLGSNLVEVEYADGLPSRITTPSQKLQLGFQKVPIVTNPGAGVVVTGFEYTLGEISSEAWGRKFPITLTSEGTYAMEVSEQGEPVSKYVWRAETGEILSDGLYTYTLTPRKDSAPLVSRKNAEGEVESYAYDQKTGLSEQILPDGMRVTRSYFIGAGPTQYKIRKVTASLEGKEISSRQWSYDEKGRKIREMAGDRVKMWEYAPEGGLVSEEERKGDSLVSRKTFDRAGRVATLMRPEFELRYSYEADKTVTQRLKDGKLQMASVTDPMGGPALEFFVQSGRTELAERDALQKVNPQDLENSKNIALRAIEKWNNEKRN